MPLGPFGEVVGTTGTLDSLTPDAQNYKSKVVAPRNPKIVREDDPQYKMTPSKYLFDMSMDTEQRLANTRTMKIPRKVELMDMGETSLQKFSQINIDEPMFQPFPSEIFFQQFEPFIVYEIPLVLRNNDKVPRLVKVTMANSPYFSIISPHDVGHKVGPGLPTTFRIQFKPDEKKDYTHELVCITEREKFVVPVLAIGARGILDFPDEINFPVCPVKYPNSKTLLVRNIGNREAKFTLSVDKPFTVTPDIGVLPMNESMQATVEFQPQQSGDHKGDLVLHYDTGEDVFISLYGAAQDSNVRLDKNSIRIENTYISMANERTVTINNRSSVIAHFKWSEFATQDEEDSYKLMQQVDLDKEERTDTDRFLEECIADPTLRDKLSVLGRTFQNRKRIVTDDKLLFSDDVVKIDPVEGDIWPNSSFDVNVVFKPREAKIYTITAFCNITGRESRLPLRIRGEGIGPLVEFSFETLNMGNIFIGSTHSYEVVLANKGDIDAIFSVMPNNSVFGPCFQFNPSEGIVMPGGHQAIQIKFNSPYLGDFQEDFYFQIDGSPEQLKIRLTGSVIGPSFQFNVPKLKFGTVSYGFLNTQHCTLMNTSLVPMTFNLRVPGDGINDSVCSTSDLDSNRSELGSMSVSEPREFEIIPSRETVPPQSEIKLTVNFVSNTVKKYDLAMVVDVDNVGEEILSLPIQAKCIVPAVTVLTPILDYGRCFLRHPYEHRIKMHNDTDLQAKYELVPQKDIMPLEECPILYSSPQPKGILPPHSVSEVPLQIEVQELEEQDIPVYVRIFGSTEPPLPVHVTCVGEGPVVHAAPLEMDWNVVPVLTDVPKVLTLANESLIPAKFSASMLRPNTVFRVEPFEGEIAPEERVQLVVTAYLDDCVRFQDKLQLNFLESQARLIPLTAFGQGTTIVSDPPLTPILNLGPNFSNRQLKKTFKLTNSGRRHQQLVWSTEGFGPIAKAKKELAAYNPLDMKNRNKPPPAQPVMPIFKLSPNRMDLPAGETAEMHLEGFVDSPRFVQEHLLCHAIIGRQGGKELVMRVDVSADFISPLLDFSTKSVFFRVDKQGGEELNMENKKLLISNVSSLPLTTELKLQYPFRLVKEDGEEVSEMEVHLDLGQSYSLEIRFDPAYKDDLHIRTIDEVLHINYKEHPHVDYIALRGEVYFPNLEFEKPCVDFGCILNDTEVTRYVNITNNSPMEVKYRWSFLIGSDPCAVFNRPGKPNMDIVLEENLMEEVEKEGYGTVEIALEEGGAKSDTEEETQQQSGDEVITDKPEKEGDENQPTDNRVEEEGNENRPPTPPSDEELEKGQLDQEAGPEPGVKKEEVERLDLRSRMSLHPDEEDALRSNRVLTALLERDQEATTPIGIEEVFDILPLYGVLQPGDTEQITLTFYGHADIWGQVKAICEVEGGPTYELTLKGEASLVEYRFDCREIDYGKQMYDQTASAEITLVNTGKVGFEFSGIGMDPALSKKPLPGIPVMVPHSGYIEPLSEQKLTVKFLPGVPERFHKNFLIQVAHFEPDVINLYGEGVFPRISLDLPRLQDSDCHYNQLLKEAKEELTKGVKKFDSHPTERPGNEFMPTTTLRIGDHATQHETSPSDLELQMEAERLAVQDFALEMQQMSYRPELYYLTPPNSHESRDTRATLDSRKKGKKMKLKPRLPEYVLDFGYVVLGTVRTHVVHATNTGWFPASFQVERDSIHNLGFHIELDRVRNLPGAPDHETVDFVVSFDPRGANLQLGPVEVIVPINILNGPQVAICLRACVTMPDMEISDDILDFSDVRCGECKVITVQLHNHQHVACEWNSLPSDKDRKLADRHIPMHLRRKLRQEKKKPQHFEIMPPTGMLLPGQRTNVQVKFMPTEERFYEHRIPIRIAQSSQRILLLCRGQGLEPRLEFDRHVAEFGPILPHSSGDEQEVVIRNPCSFPIEFYNLEFDSTYLEEEKVLRLMKGYDEYNTILLPPRSPADKLPHELLDYFDEQMKKLEEEERVKREAEEAAEAARKEREEAAQGGEETKENGEGGVTAPGITTTAASPEPTPMEQVTKTEEEEKTKKEESLEEKDGEATVGVGELEITPVSAAIARHLGIDLTPEGKAARNRRGISLIVHGPPCSGKTSSSVMLAKRYKAAILTIDGIVLEAISNGNTPAGLRARELCAEAARRRAEELRGQDGEDIEKAKPGGLSVEAVIAHTQGTGSGVVAGAPSMVSNRKTSTISDQKAKDKHHGGSVLGIKTGVNTSSVEGGTGSQVPSSPPPLAAPIARRLSVSASVAGEEGLMSCILPEELLVEILAERMQLDDCHKGVIFDGLETLFSQNYLTATNAILKALNNRRFIFFVTLKLDYNVLKEHEKKDLEEKERQARKAEEKERQRLEEMSEDEYDALSEQEKALVDQKRLAVKKERIQKEHEKAERERIQRQTEEEELRKLQEDMDKGKRKGGKKKQDAKEKDKKAATGKTVQPSQDRVGQKSQGGGQKPHDSDHIPNKAGSVVERPESHQTEKSDSQIDDKKKKLLKDGKKTEVKGKDGETVAPQTEQEGKDANKEIDMLLMQRFRTFEHAQTELVHLLEFWDRTTLQIKRPPTPSEKSEEDGAQHPPSGKKGKGKDKHDKEKEKEKERQRQLEKEMAEKAAKEAALAEGESQDGETGEETGKKMDDGVGVPNIIIDCADQSKPPGEKLLDVEKFPTVEEVMDGLGLGPQGPPIPPPAEFAVVPYPVKRRPPPISEFGGRYMFVASTVDDPNIGIEDKIVEVLPEEEKSVTPDRAKEDHSTPTKGKAKGGDKQKTASTEKSRKGSADRKKAGRRNSMQVPSPPPGATTPTSEVDAQSLTVTVDGLAITEPNTPKITIFRWVVPANGEVVIKLRFQSEELGQFDQTLNFEIVGTRRRYQLYCRGVCAFPTISREPRIVFQHRKKNKKPDEIVHKKYILMTEIFEFGPLLVGKSRDKYKEGKYPENMEQMTILNTSPLEADISFCFLNDSKADTYLLEPPGMVLKPGASQTLTIWAYPKAPGQYKDAIVCCVRENPEPIIFNVCCDGFRPELELDKKQLHFDKVLLHRKDTKTIFLRNPTQLPVAWKLSGLENLGDDFTVAAESGVVDPLSEYSLNAYFRAMKPVQTSKKMIRLEIMDVDNIMGVVHTEPVQVLAEAYDVALDMSFPRGTDGGLDFATIRVSEETKQTCNLKNKGKYEIAFNFVFENTDKANPDVTSLFSVIPQKGTLNSLDRPTQVQVIFKAPKEVTVKEQPILKCQVIEPSLGEGGEIIASIPVKVSVKSVFSKYNILPMNDINFGSLLIQSKKTRQFTIENKGEFDFKYTITKMVREAPNQASTTRNRPPVVKDKRNKSRDGSSSGRSVAKPRRAESIRQDQGAGQSRLQLGMFTIFPAFGIILPNGHQSITVDCIAENQGRSDEDISIDITERDPNDNRGGIQYKLLAEACVPAINVDDIGAIFEEHRVCKNLSVWQHLNQIESGGVYGEEEKRFVFNNVIVGRKAKARFKISNTNKVPCDVLFSLKPILTKGAPRMADIFEVDPARAQIANHSQCYITVTFTPPSMQSYSAVFEASIDGANQNKGRSLVFEVSGEGNLPRINIAKPSVRNKKGQPLLLFKKILLGRIESLPLVLYNDGTLPSKVDIDLMDPDGAFSLKPTGETRAVLGDIFSADGETAHRRPHTASVVVGVKESATFMAVFKPNAPIWTGANIKVSVVDNQYEDSIIQLVGEGYEDDITLDNIHSITTVVDPEFEEGNMAEDNVSAAKQNLIKFGECYINEPRRLTFAMTNHSKTDCIRFQWPDQPPLTFSPRIGHLHAGCSKDIAITFKSEVPHNLAEQQILCKVSKITFERPTDQVPDWDDRIRTVKWVDSPVTPPEGGKSQAVTPRGSRPTKKKIMETEPEPPFTEVAESARTVELLVSGVADYCKYKCKVESVHFKDTLMFQSRVYNITLSNKGQVQMDFNWQVVMDSFTPSLTRVVTFMSEGERPDSRTDVVDSSYIPFSIEPQYGTIQPRKKATCTVKFSPLDVSDYEGRLVCSIANLENLGQGPVIGVKGRSIMPYCHFELPDSDYITGAKRNPELRGPGGAPPGSTLDPNTRVIEFNCVGIGVTSSRDFGIVNPTSHTYNFEWICEDELDPKEPSCFKCQIQKGEIRSGRKFKAGFQFTSRQTDIVESFWRFVIPDQNISVPFLLVGNTREPDISMDRSHLSFKALLIGRTTEEQVYLINNEDTAFNFSFMEDSCHSEGYAANISIQPMSGVIPSKSRVPVNLVFSPTSDKEVNFNLICKIKKKILPVTLNVKAEGYSMSCTVLCEDSAGNRVELSDKGLNEINFGEIEINEQAMRNLFILNSGKFNFDYKWELNERSTKKGAVTISPSSGGLLHGDKQKCMLTFCPSSRMSLRGCELSLKISNGPTYDMTIVGLGVTPGLHFSYHSHNFGNCFIHRAGMPEHSSVLKLTNKDTKEISVDCLYLPTNHLHHNFEASVIAPGDSVDVTFTFYPREAIKYHDVVTFEVNALSKQTIEFTGQGTEMKIEVADPKSKIVNLGARYVGDVVKKYIPIVNNSPAAITFSLALTPTTPALQQPEILQISPTHPLKLGPRGGTCKVEVAFRPKTRIPQFTEEVMLECSGLHQPLFVVKGSCLGMEISLDSESIPFGTVVQRSQSSRRLVMMNTGDMNAKFRWDIKKFAPDFSISPVEGYITSGSEVTFDVAFHPQEINQDIRYEKLRCFLDGGPHKPVTLTLTGMCTGVGPSREVQHFTTHVRQKDVRSITLVNRTNQNWLLKPIIDGEYWTGPVTIAVEPQQTKSYELTYKPLTMTTENKKHMGTIFFPLPDGTGLLYNLTGTAEPPKPNGKIQRDIPCKTSYHEVLPVHNWLKRPQRFRVKIESVKPDKFDPGTTVKGMEYIDVPASTKKDYKLSFYAYREGLTTLKVTFSNEQTLEYQYYEVSFRATKPGVLSSIDLSTPVRQSVPHMVKIENPLQYPVTFSVSCNIPEILMPAQLQIQAQSEGRFSLEYQPLKVGEVQGRLEFNCSDLGLYTYDLNLKATPAGPEKALYFRTCLGQNQGQIAKFLNFAKQKTDYTCKMDNSDFHVDKTVAAAPGSTGGTEVAIELTFEPSKLGEQRANLTVSSQIGGEYTFPLFGTCIPPKPQGPFLVKAGSTTPITFRNIFGSTTPFTFQVDNPLFHVTKQGESIRSRKDHRIVVGFEGNDTGSKASVMGKLIVTCARSAGGTSSAQWVFYLKGVTP